MVKVGVILGISVVKLVVLVHISGHLGAIPEIKVPGKGGSKV